MVIFATTIRDKVGSIIKLNHKRFKQKINNTELHLGIVLIYMCICTSLKHN